MYLHAFETRFIEKYVKIRLYPQRDLIIIDIPDNAIVAGVSLK